MSKELCIEQHKDDRSVLVSRIIILIMSKFPNNMYTILLDNPNYFLKDNYKIYPVNILIDTDLENYNKLIMIQKNPHPILRITEKNLYLNEIQNILRNMDDPLLKMTSEGNILYNNNLFINIQLITGRKRDIQNCGFRFNDTHPYIMKPDTIIMNYRVLVSNGTMSQDIFDQVLKKLSLYHEKNMKFLKIKVKNIVNYPVSNNVISKINDINLLFNYPQIIEGIIKYLQLINSVIKMYMMKNVYAEYVQMINKFINTIQKQKVNNKTYYELFSFPCNDNEEFMKNRISMGHESILNAIDMFVNTPNSFVQLNIYKINGDIKCIKNNGYVLFVLDKQDSQPTIENNKCDGFILYRGDNIENSEFIYKKEKNDKDYLVDRIQTYTFS